MSAELNGNLTPEEQLTGALDTSAQLVGRLDIGAGGGGGTDNYNDLTNKPKINDVTLSGNKTTADLGLFSGNYNDLTNKPTIPSHLNQLSDVHYAPEEMFNDDILIWVNGGWYASTQSYQLLANKPEINGHTLIGNKTTADLGLFSGDYNDLTNKPNLATVATTGAYNDLSGKPLFSVITRSKTMSLAAGASGYFQLDDVLNFPASNSYLIGFFGYAALTYATRGTIMSAGLIENGAKPYIHYQVGEAGFSDVPFYFRFVFYTP